MEGQITAGKGPERRWLPPPETRMSGRRSTPPHPSEALTTTSTRGGREALPVRPATRKGSASRGTPEGQPATWHRVEQPQVYQDQLNRHTKEAQQELTTPVAGVGKRRYSTAATERKSPKANTTGATREGGLQRWPPRLDTRGERERGE